MQFSWTPLGFTPTYDQASTFQNLEMLGDRGLGYFKGLY